MLDRLGTLYAMLLGWPGLARLHKAALYFSMRALGIYNHQSSTVSGEAQALRRVLVGRTAPVVFDVGANEGHWTAEVLALCPDAHIHAFEPQEQLAKHIAKLHPGVFVNNLALGAEAGSLELHDYADRAGSPHASLLAGVIDGLHHGRARKVQVVVGTVDNYCLERSIERIDLLKVDVEGFERQVLEGARRMIEGGCVQAVQFEFNEMNVVGRTFMADFVALLGPHYECYRLLPHGLLRLQPGAHWINELFAFQNILALKAHEI
jgi:FkbM family methyltransferase